MAQFKKGISGNPAGKPKGTKDKRTKLQELFKSDAPALIQKVIDLALAGDMAALKLCLDRIVPPLRSREQPIHLDGLTGSLSEQSSQIMTAIADAQLAPGEGSALLSALATQSKILETDELISRIEKLEQEARK